VSLAVSQSKTPTTGLSQLQSEMVDIFTDLAQTIGFPRSMGALYGLLYASKQPLAADELRAALGLSLGATSQGLRALRSVRAVRAHQPTGTRKVYYEAEVELRRLLQGITREVVQPQLNELAQRIEALEAQAASFPPAEADFYRGRLTKLSRWSELTNRWLRRLGRLISWSR